MITLPIVEWFAAYLLDERHFSQYTARCYSADLRQYVEHLSGALKIIPNTDSEKAAVDARAAGSPATPRHDHRLGVRREPGLDPRVPRPPGDAELLRGDHGRARSPRSGPSTSGPRGATSRTRTP